MTDAMQELFLEAVCQLHAERLEEVEPQLRQAPMAERVAVLKEWVRQGLLVIEKTADGQISLKPVGGSA